MPHFVSADEWLKESALLIQARPTTTKVTTRYNHAAPLNRSRRRLQQRQRKPNAAATAEADQPAQDGGAQAQAPVGLLNLKTYDPVSGVCLQYRTNKGAEVGRLIAALGRLGKAMSGQPDNGGEEAAPLSTDTATKGTAQNTVSEDVIMEDAPAENGDDVKASGHQRAKKSVSFAEGPPQVQKAPSGNQAGGGGGGGGGGKKKKKGKK